MIRGISRNTVVVMAVLFAMFVQIANYIGPDKFAYAYTYLEPQDLLEAIEYSFNRESLRDPPQTSHYRSQASNHQWLERSPPTALPSPLHCLYVQLVVYS
jgi:hypothetical protein